MPQQTLTLSFSIDVVDVLAIVSPPPPRGVVGQPYSYQFQATGGDGSYTFILLSAPAGWALSADGLLTGLPAAAGAIAVSIKVVDSGK